MSDGDAKSVVAGQYGGVVPRGKREQQAVVHSQRFDRPGKAANADFSYWARDRTCTSAGMVPPPTAGHR